MRTSNRELGKAHLSHPHASGPCRRCIVSDIDRLGNFTCILAREVWDAARSTHGSRESRYKRNTERSEQRELELFSPEMYRLDIGKQLAVQDRGTRVVTMRGRY